MEAPAATNPTLKEHLDAAGFHGGHFALMGGAAVLLIVLGIAQTPAFLRADAFAKKYSNGNLYANADPSTLPSPELTQYALNYQRVQQGLNPVNPDGSEYAYAGSRQAEAVLGASTYDKSIPQKFASLNVATLSDNSDAAVQAYASQASVVLTNEDVSGATPAQLKNVAASLQAIAAPSSLEDYQRLLVESFLLRANGDPQHELTEVQQVLETISESLQGTANITLPVPK